MGAVDCLPLLVTCWRQLAYYSSASAFNMTPGMSAGRNNKREKVSSPITYSATAAASAGDDEVCDNHSGDYR